MRVGMPLIDGLLIVRSGAGIVAVGGEIGLGPCVVIIPRGVLAGGKLMYG